MSRLELHVEWRPAPDEAAPGPESATWGRLALYVDGECLTVNVPSDLRDSRHAETREAVEGAMCWLAEWVVDSWPYVSREARTPFPRTIALGRQGVPLLPGRREASLGWPDPWAMASDEEVDELSDWQHRHTLGMGICPLALPSMVLLPEGRWMQLVVDDLAFSLSPSVAFERPACGEAWPAWYTLGRAEVLQELWRFYDEVRQRAASYEQAKPWAEWVRDRAAEALRLEQDESFRRRASLGDVGADYVARLEGQPEVARAVGSILEDCQPATDPEQIEKWARTVQTILASGRDGDGVPRWAPEPNLPWHEQGYRLAARLREHLGLGNRPVTDVSGVLTRLGIGLHQPLATAMFRTAVVASANGRTALLQGTEDPHMQTVAGSRFALCAAVGRALARPSTNGHAFGAAHGVNSRLIETRRANAFAAEFLLPTGALKPYRDSDQVPSEVFEDFGISSSAGRWHVHNRLGADLAP